MWGPECPRCGRYPTEWLDTTSEWEYWCEHCDVRFNKRGETMEVDENGVVLPEKCQVIAMLEGGAKIQSMVQGYASSVHAAIVEGVKSGEEIQLVAVPGDERVFTDILYIPDPKRIVMYSILQPRPEGMIRRVDAKIALPS